MNFELKCRDNRIKRTDQVYNLRTRESQNTPYRTNRNLEVTAIYTYLGSG